MNFKAAARKFTEYRDLFGYSRKDETIEGNMEWLKSLIEKDLRRHGRCETGGFLFTQTDNHIIMKPLAPSFRIRKPIFVREVKKK